MTGSPERPSSWGRHRLSCLPVSGLRAGLERIGFGEALDRFELCVVLRDALGCQMWVVEPGSHDDSDALDRSGFHVVDAVAVRTTIACQPHDRWRDRLN